MPPHFIGRDDTLIDIDRVLRRGDARMAITALHGLRGVGKTVLAAAYAELHRGDYRATWWVRAETEPSLRADLAALGMRLGWVAADEKEAAALAAIGERLRHEGDGILLIFDNAVDADALLPYLPRGGAARVLVTSNAYAWRGLAEPVEIRVWPKEIGAEFLVARTGRGAERKAAEDLSEALGGLPLAHEQAAAYCERLEIRLAEYARRFAATPARLLDAGHDAPAEYHDRLTVAKTFALAIDEAAKLHPAAEMLIVHAALLAPEPIPLFLFAEAGEKFGERLAALLADDGLDEAVAALRAFALVDRETIEDERDPAISTDTIRLHRLVREVAASRCDGEAREEMRRALVEALAAIYPQGVFNDPKTWPRARRLDALALTLVGGDAALPDGAAMPRELFAGSSWLIPAGRAGSLCIGAAAVRTRAGDRRKGARPRPSRYRGEPQQPRHCCCRTRAISPRRGRSTSARWRSARRRSAPTIPIPRRASTTSPLCYKRRAISTVARPLFERALAIREKALGPDHPDTAASLNNLAAAASGTGRSRRGAAALRARADDPREGLGRDHPDTATSLNNLAFLLQAQGDLAAARPFYRAGAADLREGARARPSYYRDGAGKSGRVGRIGVVGS